jgi:3-isopropylmalate/(R)-2-methylmalate dehydratase small subunit
MEQFISITGPAAPFLHENIDTDVIIRIERLTNIQEKKMLGKYAMETLRYLADGQPNPDFIFNVPGFEEAPILLAGANFGCGSSREAAVWALRHMGVRCVIAPSFGDIFFSNCFLNGVLPITLPHPVLDLLSKKAINAGAFTVDLKSQEVLHPDGEITRFQVDARRREFLLTGTDEIDLTLKDDATTREWQAQDRLNRPWVWNYAAR